MCAGTPVHISRHLGKTSNNNKRCQLYIHCMLAEFASTRFYFGFPVLWSLWFPILWSLWYYSCLHPVLSLVFHSTSLMFLSNHIMSIPYLISFDIYLLAFVCLCQRYSFQCLFMIQIYRYTCAYLCMPLGVCITTCWGILTSLNPRVQVLELGACRFSRMLIKNAQQKRGSLADRPEPVSYTHLTLPTIYSV